MGEILADDDFKSGRGIPFIALEGEGDDAKFCMCDEAKQFLCALKAPVALASIVGKYRTGKSLLVNRMLLDIKGGGFPVGATVNSCTKGLWIWNKPLLCKQGDGQEMQLLIIDTEGLGSLDADADHDAKIFALALLLSSYFIYNSVGSIDEAALNSLSLVVELTKHIKTKSEKESNEPETGETFANFFPAFLWVVRDFTLQLVDENDAPITTKSYLDRALRPMQGFSEGVEVKNRIRRMLQAFFPNRDCVTLKRPVEDEAKLQTLDGAEWSDFRPEFVDQVQALRKKIFSSAAPKMVNGKVLDGFMLASLAEQYAHSINTGSSLNIGDAWSQVSASKNAKAMEEAAAAYEAAARAQEGALPLSVEAIQEWHARVGEHAHELFRRESMGAADEFAPFAAQLAARVEAGFLRLKQANDREAREAAGGLLAGLYAEVAAAVGAGKVASYKEFEAARRAVREDYLQKCPDTPAKMDVLLGFMESKVPLAALQLEEHAAAAVEAALADKDGQMRAAAHEFELERRRAAGLMEEMTTKLARAEATLADGVEREQALKSELEEARARHERELAEEIGALRGEMQRAQAALEGEVDRLAAQGKAAGAKAAEEKQELATQLALLEQQSSFAAADKQRLEVEHAAVAAQLADTTKELSVLKAAHRKLEAEAASSQEAERSRDAFTNSCNERVEVLEVQLGDAHRDIAVLRDRLALAQQQQQQESLLPPQQQHVLRGAGVDSGDGRRVAGASRGAAGDRGLVQGVGGAGETDGGGGLQAELLEARGRLVEAQQRALEYADEMRSMRGEMERLQRLYADQHTQLESVTAVNLYCLQRAAAVEALERSVSELASQKQQAEQQRDAALRDVRHLRIQLSPPHVTAHPHENGAPAPREGKNLGRQPSIRDV